MSIKISLLLLIFSILMNEFTIFETKNTSDADRWQIVNDGVMGGLSEGTFTLDEAGHAVFEGVIRLENNGGFSSVRKNIGSKDVSAYTKLKLRLRADGKPYQVRVKTSQRDYQSYIAYVDTSTEWATYEIDLEEMYPSFRGRRLRMPNYPAERLGEFAILFGNKKAEGFRLVIDKIWLE